MAKQEVPAHGEGIRRAIRAQQEQMERERVKYAGGSDPNRIKFPNPKLKNLPPVHGGSQK